MFLKKFNPKKNKDYKKLKVKKVKKLEVLFYHKNPKINNLIIPQKKNLWILRILYKNKWMLFLK